MISVLLVPELESRIENGFVVLIYLVGQNCTSRVVFKFVEQRETNGTGDVFRPPNWEFHKHSRNFRLHGENI